jgi:hypothetical protein
LTLFFRPAKTKACKRQKSSAKVEAKISPEGGMYTTKLRPMGGTGKMTIAAMHETTMSDINQPAPIDDCTAKLALEIIGLADRGKLTLGLLERSLAEFAAQIRREIESQ